MEIVGLLLWLLFGVAVGTYGTLVGAGGGFIVVPALLLIASASPQQAVGTSLLVVALNALSGTLSYARMGRIDYTTGWRFALATLPGSIAGAYLSTFFSGPIFTMFFGGLLLIIAAFLVFRPTTVVKARPVTGPRRWWEAERCFTDAFGETHHFRYNEPGGLLLSVVVGFLSSILGLGGGIIHVPAMIQLFGFPAHIATATSHFILAISAVIGAGSHLALGHVMAGPGVSMGLGAIAGAQLGARLSRRLRGSRIVQYLALALAIVGLRLLWSGL